MGITGCECTSCPNDYQALHLIETRFENGSCFLELECKHCGLFWTGEVAMFDRWEGECVDTLAPRNAPYWQVVAIRPKHTRAVDVSRIEPAGHQRSRYAARA